MGFIITLVIAVLLATPALAEVTYPAGVVAVKGDGVQGLGYSLGHGKVVTSLHIIRSGKLAKVDGHWAKVVKRGDAGLLHPIKDWEQILPRGCDWAIVQIVDRDKYLKDAPGPKAVGYLPEGIPAVFYCDDCGATNQIELGVIKPDHTQEYTGEAFSNGCSGGPVLAGDIFVGIVTANYYSGCVNGQCSLPLPGDPLGFLTLWQDEWFDELPKAERRATVSVIGGDETSVTVTPSE